MYVAGAAIACMHNVLLALTKHLACIKLAYKCKPRFAKLSMSNEAQLLTLNGPHLSNNTKLKAKPLLVKQGGHQYLTSKTSADIHAKQHIQQTPLICQGFWAAFSCIKPAELAINGLFAYADSMV